MKSFLIYCAELLSRPRGVHDSMILVSKDEWILSRYKGLYVMSIHGSFGFKEWKSNFFKNGWEECANEVIEEYNQLYPYWKPDYVIGYSRGGALALLIAEKWQCRCVTFSSPKIAAKELDFLLTYPPIMISPKYDIVARIPPWRRHPKLRISVQVPGWRHRIINILEIGLKRIQKIQDLLNWPVGNKK